MHRSTPAPRRQPPRHRAPTTFSRATDRLSRLTTARGLRRKSGAALAVGAVTVFGMAADGLTGDDTPVSEVPTAAVGLSMPPEQSDAQQSDAQQDVARQDVARQREELTREASRDAAGGRAPLGRRAERRDADIAADPSDSTGGSTARAGSLQPTDPHDIAQEMLADYGWDATQYGCLDELWISESNWDVDAENPTSGAYGIPQSLPPEKMASAGDDWRTNPATQIAWGLEYIDLSYGTPCSAWEFKQANNWY